MLKVLLQIYIALTLHGAGNESALYNTDKVFSKQFYLGGLRLLIHFATSLPRLDDDFDLGNDWSMVDVLIHDMQRSARRHCVGNAEYMGIPTTIRWVVTRMQVYAQNLLNQRLGKHLPRVYREDRAELA